MPMVLTLLGVTSGLAKAISLGLELGLPVLTITIGWGKTWELKTVPADMTDESRSEKSVHDSQVGILYVVGTPIGNLEDISFRAVRILKEVDLIAAEDTRHTGQLLSHFQIKTPQISYHDHNSQRRIPDLLHRLRSGTTLALVSDAGMPGISDPGYELVCACVEAKISVVPIPGASAVVTTMAVAGLPSDRFVFEGFLPVKGKARQHRLAQIQHEARTVVLYESPHRLLKTLQNLVEVLGADRSVTLARELTKRYETFWRGTLADAVSHYQIETPRGEFTIAIAGQPCPQIEMSQSELLDQLAGLIQQGLSRSEACRQLAPQTQYSRREIYQISLTIDNE